MSNEIVAPKISIKKRADAMSALDRFHHLKLTAI